MDRALLLAKGGIDRALDLFRDTRSLVDERWGNEFPDRKFLVVRRGGDCGLFSYFMTALAGIRYAREKGLVPVVDMQTIRNIYHEDGEVGRVNAWELYFRQPAGCSLPDIARAKNVIVTRRLDFVTLPSQEASFLSGQDGKIESWRELVRQAIRLDPAVAAEVEMAVGRIFGNEGGKVFGAFVRGTDYSRLHPTGHPVQPSVQEAVDAVREKMSERGCDRVFLVTEDLTVQAAFEAAFGSRLLLHAQNAIDYRGGLIGSAVPFSRREKERYHRGLDYLVNVYLFARCKYAFASRTSGSTAAALLSHDTSSVEYYDHGVYSRFA